MANNAALGRLERVALRDVWTHEETGFSRWLSLPENLKLLSEAISVELEVQAVEQNVGPFRADILCKVVGTSDHWVLVENQIERTDHGHLGQLLTYSAGLHTATIVWIAQRFTDEHRAALDWLNEITNEEISFFGLEIELWKIGDSPAAPKFNIVSKPNAWVRSGERAKVRATSSGAEFFREYWEGFNAVAANRHPIFGQARKASGDWTGWGTGKGISYVAIVSRAQRCVRARVALLGKHAKANYSMLHDYREEIDSKIPGLDWRERPEGVESYVDLTLPEVDLVSKGDWTKQHEWLLERLIQMDRVFGPFIRAIPTARGRAED